MLEELELWKNICIKRPDNGDNKAKDFIKILGKKLKKNINANKQIKKTYIKWKILLLLLEQELTMEK